MEDGATLPSTVAAGGLSSETPELLPNRPRFRDLRLYAPACPRKRAPAFRLAFAARCGEKIPQFSELLAMLNRARSQFLAALCLSAGLVAAAMAPPADAHTPAMADVWNGAEIAWTDVGSGIRESTRTGKPVIMVFHASWCSSCKRYRQVWKDPGVVAASKSFVMILVDVDQEPDANGAFSPDGTYVPRTIFYDSEGNVRTEIRGKDPEYPHTIDLDDPAELRSLMNKAIATAPPQEQPSSPAPDRRAAN